MATYKYILGRQKDDGTYPVYLKICNGNTNTMRSMAVSVAKSEWKPKSESISIRATDTDEVRNRKQRDNEFLSQFRIRVKEVESLLVSRGVLKEMSAKDFMDAIINYSPNSKQNEGNGSGDFVEYWNTIAMQTPKSQEKYIYALKNLVNYQIACTGRNSIQFRDVTVDWVRGYLSYIQNGGYQFTNGNNTIAQLYGIALKRNSSAWRAKKWCCRCRKSKQKFARKTQPTSVWQKRIRIG